MFTKARTITILCVLFIMALTLRIPVLTVFSLTWAINPRTNATYRSIRFANNIGQIYKANDIIIRNLISWLTYTTVATCVIILTNKLRVASRFRRSLALQSAYRQSQVEKGRTSGQISEPHIESSGPSSYKPDTQRAKSGQGETLTEKMSAKDLQVIQSVTLICVIFILSQLPFQIVSTVRLIDPEFTNYGQRDVLYSFVTHISNTCGYLKASFNILLISIQNTESSSLFSKKQNSNVLKDKSLTASKSEYGACQCF